MSKEGKNIIERLKDLGIVKRKLTKEERKDIVHVVTTIYPGGGDKALDLAVKLAVIKLAT